MKIKKLILLPCILLCNMGLNATNQVITVASPNGAISAEITLNETNGSLSYTVNNNNIPVVTTSALGIACSEGDFTNGLSYLSETRDQINESYTLPTGKRKSYTNKCSVIDVAFNKSSKEFHVIFRVYDDGVAFRYYIPGTGTVTVSGETSEIRIASFDKCWGESFVHDYSTLYPARNWTETANVQNENGDRKNQLSAPVLVKSTTSSNNWCLITESANYGNYCASKVMSGTVAEVGKFYYQLHGEVNTTLPLETSWKTIILGNLPTIVQSVMTENLNPPTDMTDLSWIKSGLSSWDWGGQDGGVTHDIEVIKGYIDLAYKMKWPYYTLDDGWAASSYRLKDVIDYASSKGVKVFIWSHQNRFKNDEAQIRLILQNWKDLGFVGTKIDFFDDDSQDMMQKYDKLVKIAGEVGLMVNLHGCTKPSGTRRHWPHLITSEAVYGGEQYYFNHNATPASHNVTLALTRNVIGPMDYTPTEFCRLDGIVRHLTTWSHQLALAALYESGIQTMSDSHYNYIYNISKNLLSQLPSSWDETVCLEANPEDYVSIARRKGNDWYISSISQNARTLSVPLSFLGSGNYTAQIYKDGTCPSDIAYEELAVTAASTLSVDIKATGGATIRISQTPINQPAHRVYEAENGTKSGGITTENDNLGNCSGGKFIGFLGNGNTVTINNVIAENAGKYNLTLYYITQDERNTYIRVNGGDKNIFKFNGNGYSWNSDALAIKTVQVSLAAGNNTIEFGNDTDNGINIDRIEVSPSGDYKDVKLSITGLQNGSGLTNSEPIKIKLTNQSEEQLSNVSVSYKINDNAMVTEVVPSIAAGATIDYTFTQKADLSAIAVYNVEAAVNIDLTNNIVGDMDFVTFSHYPVLSEHPVNLKLNGGSIHSYSYQVNSNEGAENLISGDSSKKWCDNNTAYPWVVMKLPKEYNINRFIFRDCKTKENDKNVDQYKISITTKNPEENAWTEVVNTVNRKQENIKVDNIDPQPALYIKFETKIPDDDNAVRIYGFDVFGTETVGIHNTASNASNVFPSVLKKKEVLHINNPDEAILSVYSTSGLLVYHRNINPKAEVSLNVSAGLYLVKVSSPDRENVNKIIVK